MQLNTNGGVKRRLDDEDNWERSAGEEGSVAGDVLEKPKLEDRS